MDYFCPRLEVTRHSECAVTVLDNGNVIKIFSIRNSVSDSHRRIKTGMCSDMTEKNCT